MIDPRSIPLLRAPFLFLRHGHTTSNRDETIAGQLDVALTGQGRREARAAGALIAPLGVTAVHCSTLSRSLETAGIIAAAIGLPILPMAGLNERNWGELQGRPRALRAAGVAPRGAESREDYLRRVAAALAAIAPGGLPLLVAHSGTYRAICELIRQDPGAEPIANCRPVLIAPDDGRWRVQALDPGPPDPPPDSALHSPHRDP